MNVREVRTALWHFRHGGIRQVREWRRRRLAGVKSPTSLQAREPLRPNDIPPQNPTKRTRTYGDVRVAVILDEFSMMAWGGDFDVVPVNPDDWRRKLEESHFELLLVESAWAGNDSAWKFQLTGSKAPSSAFRELVEYCRTRGIPTVFWNKEDPPHYDDFLQSARLFDVVFTSDERLLSKYKEDLGHDRVAVMSFAAAPSLHNPVRTSGLHERGDIAFAGMYFAHKYPERRQQMELLLGAAERVSARRKLGFDIYSRFADGKDEYQFPGRLAKHVVGSLPYSRMLSAYGAYKVFLNVNSVVDSPSMCARRVFEITASGTPVVSTASVAIPEFFPSNEVAIVKDADEADRILRALVHSRELRDRTVHLAQRRIWQRHTYAHRAAQIMRAIGSDLADRPTREREVTVMVSTNRPQQLTHVLEMVGQQSGVSLQLAVLTHGFETDAAALRQRARELGIEDTVVLACSADDSLGVCLNKLVDSADGEILAKFDDDDLYGSNYLSDSLYALNYSGADLVGKQAVHVYLESIDATVIRAPEYEHRWTSFVAGPTLVGPRSTFASTPFSDRTRGEDSMLLRDLSMAGASIYSADRFNFIQNRNARNGAHWHTWQVDEDLILANGEIVAYGKILDHVMI